MTWKQIYSQNTNKEEEKFLNEVRNDVDKYLSEPNEDLTATFDILNWWKLNAPKYKVLSQVARDILAVIFNNCF